MNRRLSTCRRGLASMEAALIAPVLFLLGLGAADAGYLMLTTHRIESGLAAGAAYLARTDGSAAARAAAANVATRGDPAGLRAARIDGWEEADVTALIRTVDNSEAGLRGGATIRIARLETTHAYGGLGLLRLAGVGQIDIAAAHEERVFGGPA